ncbi:DEAD/DEAH box helicase, partial [Tepidiforma sp.]|uniref:DEAD/DEAH box helicase n=1 Tax=Tepidiforma sp. TaxID=2682230 RepID=UPI002ADD5C62
MRRPLYAHQETAILKVAAGRNVIIATGTGSGKTETFLVPILDALLRQRADGRLGPGVRALLLYPMNALANDQVSRLRSILASAPEITFGRYIGETAQTYKQALEDYQGRNEGQAPLPNELISREQMQATPPNILLTNYAMLEYLLMRPDDSPLFSVQTEDTWRFLVLDEVHTYNGTTGLEIAMLLRRLFTRVHRGPDQVRCIGTSATIAGGEGDLPLVAAFAERLFGAPLEYDPGDTSRQDVVLAERRPDQLEGPELDLGLDVFKAETPDQQLLRDRRVHQLVTTLREGPRSLDGLAAQLFPGDPEARGRTASLVNRLSSTKAPGHDDPVLRARYHTFVRAIGGVQVCLRPHGPDGSYRFTLADDRWCDLCGEGAALSELASCRKCNQWHLRGCFQKEGSGFKFSRQLDWDDTAEAIVYLGPGDPEVEADEEMSIEEEAAQPFLESAKQDATVSRRLVMCRVCLATGETAPGCSCSPGNPLPLIRAATKRGRPDIRYCVNCGASSAQNGPRRLRPGQDGPPAVLASALYDNLPRENEAPKFISFADSRQDAAFFAPYLGRTYGNANRRRLILSVISEMWKDRGEQPPRISDIELRLRQAAEESGHFTGDVTPLKRPLIPRMWLLAELSAVDQRQSLAGVGLLARRAARPEGWRTPPDMPAGLAALGDDESWTLVETLVGQLLDRGILALGKDIDP